MNFAVLQFPASNCDQDAVHVLRNVFGCTARLLWHKEQSLGEADAGIVIDGAGIGSAIAANKVKGVRAAMATTETIARYSREHNGANVLALGSTLVTPDEALRIVETFLATPMQEARYLARLAKVRRLEEP